MAKNAQKGWGNECGYCGFCDVVMTEWMDVSIWFVPPVKKWGFWTCDLGFLGLESESTPSLISPEYQHAHLKPTSSTIQMDI